MDYKFKKARDFYYYTDKSSEEIYSAFFEESEQNFEDYFEKKLKLSEKENLEKLAKRFGSKSDRLFLSFELAIYEGSFKIAQANCLPIIPFRDKRKDTKLKIRFLNTTQDRNELYYYELRKNARLCLNVWCIDLQRRSFCLGSACMNLFTEKGFLKQQEYDFYLWPMQKYKEDLN